MTAIAGIASMAFESARQVEWLGSENQRLRAEVDLDHDMVGDSAAMRDVYQLIERVATSEYDGFGLRRERHRQGACARAIHRNSPRRDQPFVAINCAALTETLLESELFGHERGAFTGAVTQKRGQLEMANTGTIFLDEMGEISPALQAKLLRVLQERDFMRVGGTRSIPLNIRVIAATNKNLLTATRDGTFREDFYYRLNVVAITMPPLRDRKEDIPQLANHFAAKCAEKCNRQIMGISPDAGTLFKQYDWPGNIRELENAIERAVVLGSSGHDSAGGFAGDAARDAGAVDAVVHVSRGGAAVKATADFDRDGSVGRKDYRGGAAARRAFELFASIDSEPGFADDVEEKESGVVSSFLMRCRFPLQFSFVSSESLSRQIARSIRSDRFWIVLPAPPVSLHSLTPFVSMKVAPRGAGPSLASRMLFQWARIKQNRSKGDLP